MTIDEIERQIFIDSEEVCGNTMIDIYQASEYVEQAYNKAIDDFKKELVKESHYLEGHYGAIYEEDVYKIAEQLKVGGENGKERS